MRRLGIIKANAADIPLQSLGSEGEHGGRSRGVAEQCGGGAVDTAVCGLCREYDSNQQLKRRAVVKLGRRLGIGSPEAHKDLLAFPRP